MLHLVNNLINIFIITDFEFFIAFTIFRFKLSPGSLPFFDFVLKMVFFNLLITISIVTHNITVVTYLIVCIHQFTILIIWPLIYFKFIPLTTWLLCCWIKHSEHTNWMFICISNQNFCCASIEQFCSILIVMMSHNTHFAHFLEQSKDVIFSFLKNCLNGIKLLFFVWQY